MDDLTESLCRPLYKNGQYENPWDTWSWPWGSLEKVQAGIKFFMGIGDESNVPKSMEVRIES